jgi:hypothetical protein
MELTAEDLLQVMFNPGAPLPASWPPGGWGAFLMFTMMPASAGIPFGIILARNAGLSPIETFALYLVSDIFIAIRAEPMVMLCRWLAHRVSWIAWIGRHITRLTGAAGLAQPGVRGPLGIVMLSFVVSMATARAAAVAAGHGVVMGWTLAIIGDLVYFVILMAATLWLSGVLGDERTTISIVLLAIWVVPMVIRKWRERPKIEETLATVPVAAESAHVNRRRRNKRRRH